METNDGSGSSRTSAPSIPNPRDLVADLVKFPFVKRTVEEKKEILLAEPPRPLVTLDTDDIDLAQPQYDKFDWLCGSVQKHGIFCWPCLIMGKKRACFSDGLWESVNGFKCNASKHPKSREHKSCALLYNIERNKVLNRSNLKNDNREMERKKFNEDVKKNQEIIKSIIDMVFIYINNYEDHSLKFESIIALLNLIWKSKPELKNHWLSQKYFNTHQSFLNTILECIKEELIVFMESEINKCKFYSCYCDDLFSLTGTNHCSLSIRLVDSEGLAHEYFLGFFELSKTRDPEDMFALLFNNLRLYNIKEKLVGYTFDGTSVATGKQISFQNIMSNMPNCLFSHCFSRPLLSVIKQSCSKILKLGEFFSHFEGIMEFLSKLRIYHIKNLEEIVENNFELPESDSLDLVTCKNMTFVLQQRENLLALFKEMVDSPNFNAEIITKADFYQSKLCELDFMFYLHILKDIFSSITVLETSLLRCFKDSSFNSQGVQAISRCLVTLNNWKNDAFFLAHIASLQPKNQTLVLDSIVVDLCKAKYQAILETVIRQLGERFLTFEKFDFMQLSDFTSTKLHARPMVKSACSVYSCFNEYETFLQVETLMITRKSVFKDEDLQSVVKHMVCNNTKEVLPIAFDLFVLLLTLPLNDEDNESSCYRRVRKYLKNAEPLESLFSPYALLFIEQDTLKRFKEKETFYDDILKRFSTTTAGLNICVPLVEN